MNNENEYNNYLKRVKVPYLIEIDDSLINSGKTWSSMKISSELLDTSFNKEVVQSLPTTGDSNTIYFVPIQNGGAINYSEEYLYINDAWELIGTTQIDLSDYYTSEQTDDLLDERQIVTYIVDLSTSSTVYSTSIEPNKMYMFGEKEELTITELISGRTDIVNEYMFQFTSGSIATTLNVPNTVVWLKDPDIQTSKKYAVSIENNLGIIGEWDDESV